MTPLVSILIPAYNAEKWIADTLRSAIAQTWERTEIIVVDDGSTDRTLEIAKKFESDSVRAVTQNNQGASGARNKAFSLSSGEYIQWLDADDLLAPDKISRQMEAVNYKTGKPTLLSSSFGHFMYRPANARFVPSALWCDLSPCEFLFRKLDGKLFMMNSAWLVSREVTKAAGPWDVTMFHDDDGEYFCRILLASEGVHFVPEAKAYYRSVGATSLSNAGKSDRKLEALWRSMQLHIRYLRSLEDSERTRAASVKYLQNYLIDFYPFRPDIVKELNLAAQELRGQLEAPRLSWKYSWIKSIGGRSLATRAQMYLPTIKWSLKRYWDHFLFQLEHGEIVGDL